MELFISICRTRCSVFSVPTYCRPLDAGCIMPIMFILAYGLPNNSTPHIHRSLQVKTLNDPGFVAIGEGKIMAPAIPVSYPFFFDVMLFG